MGPCPLIGSAVGLLDRPATLLPVLHALGRRHVAYGVEAHHYRTVGAALLKTLAMGPGERFTPEVKEAWTAMYAVVAREMQRESVAVAA